MSIVATAGSNCLPIVSDCKQRQHRTALFIPECGSSNSAGRNKCRSKCRRKIASSVLVVNLLGGKAARRLFWLQQSTGVDKTVAHVVLSMFGKRLDNELPWG